jgi:hypothetical protein
VNKLLKFALLPCVVAVLLIGCFQQRDALRSSLEHGYETDRVTWWESANSKYSSAVAASATADELSLSQMSLAMVFANMGKSGTSSVTRPIPLFSYENLSDAKPKSLFDNLIFANLWEYVILSDNSFEHQVNLIIQGGTLSELSPSTYYDCSATFYTLQCAGLVVLNEYYEGKPFNYRVTYPDSPSHAWIFATGKSGEVAIFLGADGGGLCYPYGFIDAIPEPGIIYTEVEAWSFLQRDNLEK